MVQHEKGTLLVRPVRVVRLHESVEAVGEHPVAKVVAEAGDLAAKHLLLRYAEFRLVLAQLLGKHASQERHPQRVLEPVVRALYARM